MSEIKEVEDIKRLDIQIAELKEKRKAKQAQAKLKLIEKLGKEVVKSTKVESLSEFHNRFKVVPVDDQEHVGADNSEILVHLKEVANNMNYNGLYWEIKRITQFTQWLSQFRDDEN